MSEDREPTIEMEGFLRRTTKKAILVTIGEGPGAKDYWLPWSDVELPDGWRIGPCIFLASPWILEEKGLS